MTWPLLSLHLGLILLFAGGESLVRGSSKLALRLGLTPLIVGLTVVAFGTSAPELVASIKAAVIADKRRHWHEHTGTGDMCRRRAEKRGRHFQSVRSRADCAGCM